MGKKHKKNFVESHFCPNLLNIF